jgi:hypothetical protein
MKSRFFATAILAVLTATVTWAQSSVPLEAKIPFPFRVGATPFPAGEYLIQPIGLSMPVLRIAALDGTQSVMTLVQGVTRRHGQVDGKLVFHRYGNVSFLSQIWQPGDTGGRELMKSAAEREMARAANQPAEVTTTVAGLQR